VVTLGFTDGYNIRFTAGAILEVNLRQNPAVTSGVNLGFSLEFRPETGPEVNLKVESGFGQRLKLEVLV